MLQLNVNNSSNVSQTYKFLFYQYTLLFNANTYILWSSSALSPNLKTMVCIGSLKYY